MNRKVQCECGRMVYGSPCPKCDPPKPKKKAVREQEALDKKEGEEDLGKRITEIAKRFSIIRNKGEERDG